MALTSIITVNYNQPQVTLEFLKSLLKNTKDNNIELILIDNGSDEDHGDTFKLIYPDLKYIRSKNNLGFAGGNNLGVKEATGDFLLFLNNDTELTTNLVPILTKEFHQNPSIGLLSPLIVYHENKNKIQYAGFSAMNYLTGRNKGIGHLEEDNNQYENLSCETGFVHGAAMMCRRTDLEEVGLMDENYFLYYEELDWCEKFKRAGKKIWFTGKTKIFHKESMSVGKFSTLKTYFLYRNRMLYIRKNAKPLSIFLFTCYYITVACPKTIVKNLLINRLDLIPWVLKAIKWNLTNPINSNVLGYKFLDR